MSEWVLTHQPCPACGSSDAYSVNSEGWGTCFSCEHKQREGDSTDQPKTSAKSKGKSKPVIYDGHFQDLRKRGISEATCEKFGYRIHDLEGEGPVQIAPYYDASGRLVASKIRDKDKNFRCTGAGVSELLFGRKLWGAGGKRVVITEGEIDAMCYAEVTNCRWPVVSVPNGAGGAVKTLKANVEWLESFGEIVLWFDADEAGQKAIEKCAPLFSPGKVKVVRTPSIYKDCCDLLMEAGREDVQKAVWNADPYRPDGIVNAEDTWALVSKPLKMGIQYPWVGLNKMLFGQREREIVTWTAGSGVGKSTICAEIGHHLLGQGHKVGYIGLEEGVDRSALRFMAVELNKPIHLPGTEVEEAERRKAFDATCGTGRLFLYDHFGSMSTDNLLSKMRYMVKGMDVSHLIFDHLSILVSGMELDGDERRAIDYTMTALRSFTEETRASLHLVSHLKRPSGDRGHEQGAQTALSQLRGSQAIAQLSDAVIGAERNQQDDDEDERNVVSLRVLKNRYAGITGVACQLEYDHQTGRLKEISEDVGTSSGSDDY